MVEWDRGNGWWVSRMTLRHYESERYSHRVPDQTEKMSVSSHMHACQTDLIVRYLISYSDAEVALRVSQDQGTVLCRGRLYSFLSACVNRKVLKGS